MASGGCRRLLDSCPALRSEGMGNAIRGVCGALRRQTYRAVIVMRCGPGVREAWRAGL
jgi:hypothetical protein